MTAQQAFLDRIAGRAIGAPYQAAQGIGGLRALEIALGCAQSMRKRAIVKI